MGHLLFKTLLSAVFIFLLPPWLLARGWGFLTRLTIGLLAAFTAYGRMVAWLRTSG